MSPSNFSKRKEVQERDSVFSFKKSFLLAFTKGLIENYGPGEFFKLKEFVLEAQNKGVEIKQIGRASCRERV